MTFAFVSNDTVTQYPIGLVEIRRRFPETSFPNDIETVDLSSFGVVAVENSPQPTIDSRFQKLEEGTPELIDGVWKQKWDVIALTPDEIQAIQDGKAGTVRKARNSKLASCDWTQLPDAPVNAAPWAIYRQELRDITSQAGFPWEVTWPNEPA